MKTKITIYRNKRNHNKYLEVHNDGYYHNSVRQFLYWKNGVINKTGDRLLHRWRIENLNELLEDHELIVKMEVMKK